MINVTAAGRKTIANLFQDKSISPVRISLAIGGCGIRFLNGSPNEGKKSDLRARHNAAVTACPVLRHAPPARSFATAGREELIWATSL